MFKVKVIFLSMACFAVTTGNNCMKRFVKGKWKSYGDCSENRELINGIADGIRERATKEKGVTQVTPTPATQEVTTTSPGPDWRKSGDRFYKCFNDELATYTDANSSCIRYGGRLAAEVLRNPKVASYVISHCFNDSLPGMTPWIGFDEIAAEGQWKWSDGGAMNPVTTQWLPGEPNNNGGTVEDCGNIWKVSTDKLLLNDAGCNSHLTYICEV